MCDLDHHHHDDHFGFLVDTPQLRALIDETRRLTASIPDVAARVEALRPAFEALLARDGWLPDSCAHAGRDQQDGRRHRPVRAVPRRRQVAVPLLARRARRAPRRRFTITWPGAWSASIAGGRTKPSTGASTTAAIRRMRTLEVAEAAGARARRVLRAAAADRRHPLRQHDLRHAVDLHSPARQRHRVRLAAQVRAGHRRRHAVPIRLRQRAVPAGVLTTKTRRHEDARRRLRTFRALSWLE